MPITFTVDLEDPTERYETDGRYVLMTQRLLNLCDEFRCRATFFTIGRIATSAPNLIKDISRRGHEIAYHSHAHVPLTQEEPNRFRQESEIDISRFEQLIGKKVIGFRAPQFSLTPQCLWALDILAELGFRYSSSLMPTFLSRYGYPGAPRQPFKWPNGIIELPLPVANFGPCPIPYLGGIYLYALPLALTRFWKRRALLGEVLWTYTHPYDFDREVSFLHMPHVPHWINIVLGAARYVAETKIRGILTDGHALPLGERLPTEAISFPYTHS